MRVRPANKKRSKSCALRKIVMKQYVKMVVIFAEFSTLFGLQTGGRFLRINFDMKQQKMLLIIHSQSSALSHK